MAEPQTSHDPCIDELRMRLEHDDVAATFGVQASPDAEDEADDEDEDDDEEEDDDEDDEGEEDDDEGDDEDEDEEDEDEEDGDDEPQASASDRLGLPATPA